MMTTLHRNATTPAVYAHIQQFSANGCELSGQLGISGTTAQRWKKRNPVEGRSHTPHRPQTALDASQGEQVADLRRQLRLPAG